MLASAVTGITRYRQAALHAVWDQTVWDQTVWDQTVWDQTVWDQTVWDRVSDPVGRCAAPLIEACARSLRVTGSEAGSHTLLIERPHVALHAREIHIDIIPLYSYS